MKRIAKLLLLAALAVVVAGAAPAFGEPPATLATWSLANTLTGTTIVPDALVVGDIAAGNGVGSLSLSGKGYSGHGWNSASRNEDAYFEFSVTAITNWSFSPGELSMNFSSTKTGPAKAEVRWSLDGSAWTTAGTMDVPLDGNDRGHPFTVDFTGVTVGSGETFAIRIYAWGASANTGTFRIGNAYAMTLSGSVAAPLDPSAAPRLGAIDDVEVDVGETVSFPVLVDAPETAPVTSLEITAGDPAATLEDGVFSFTPAAAGRYAFTLSAVNANGDATISFNVDASPASDALVVDSTFETGVSGWDVYKESGGKCTLQARDGKLMLAVSSVGTAPYSVQTFYDGVPLYKNGRYRVKYDISCTTDRHVEAMIQQNGGTYQAYTWRELEIKPEPQTVDYEFTMNQDSDRMSKFVFNCGLFEKDSALPEHTIYIDNVSLELLNPEEVVPPVTIYPLWVGGVQVTSANATNILGDGTAWFEGTATNGTLFLADATITGTYQFMDGSPPGTAAVYADFDFDLEIALSGSNRVVNTNGTSWGCYPRGNLVIAGDGVLDVEAGTQGIFVSGSLLVRDATVVVDCHSACALGARGIAISNAVVTAVSEGNGPAIESSGDLVIADSTVVSTGIDRSIQSYAGAIRISGASRVTAETLAENGTALFARKDVVLEGDNRIVAPAGGWIGEHDTGFYAVRAVLDPATDAPATRVVIAPVEFYPLWVGGVQVCTTNQNDILGDGTASFVPSASGGTLSLSNATITATYAFEDAWGSSYSANVFSGEGFDLAISLTGSNILQNAENTDTLGVHAGDDGIRSRGNLAITGGGALVARGNYYGTGLETGGNLLIDGAIVTAIGGNYGIYVRGGLAISNAVVTAHGGGYDGISSNGDIVIADSVVTATGWNGIYAHDYTITVSGASILTAETTYDDEGEWALGAEALVLRDGLAISEPAGGVFGEDGWGSGCVIDPATGAPAKRVVIDRRFAVTVVDGSTTNTTARAGETVTIVANAPAEGEGFVEWSADDAMDLSFATAAATTTTFAMPARAVTVTAVFKEIQIDSIPDQEWTGSAVEPDVRAQLKNVDLELVPGETYTVSYTNNVDPGTATATVTMAPPRTGHASVTFQILPPPEPPAVSNVVARQRWPWNGLVDVDYEVGGDTNLLAGVTARITFVASDGRSWTATNFLAGAEPSVEPGPHRATWDAAADAGAGVVASNVVATVELVPQPTFPSVPRIRAIVGETKAVQLFVVPDGEELNFANALLNEDFYVYAPLAGSDSVSFTLAGSGESLANGHHVNSGENMTILVSVKGLRPVRDVVVGTSKTDDLSDVIIHRVFDFYESDDDPDAAASAASAEFRLDTREGPFESDGTETLTYSSIWHGDTNATVTILQDGDEDEPVASGLLDEGDAVWQVFEDGTYVLTHVTTTNVAVSPVCNEETATFVVRGHPPVEAALRWKYAKNANGWHCAQVALTWHPSYADEISDMRLLFADRYEDSEPLAVIKVLDDDQAAFFEVPEMIKMAGNDWKYYFLNDENGKVYSERFLESGYREKLDERPTVSDGDEAGTLTSWGGSDDSTRYITNGVLNADGTSFSDDITFNGRTVTLKFASKPHGLGRRTAYLVDPATVVDPLGSTETYRDVEYRVAPVDLTAFAGLADGARAVYGVSDATMASSLDSVPKAERKICLRVVNRDYSTVGRADDKLAILAWNVGGRPRFLPLAETIAQQSIQHSAFSIQHSAPRPLLVAEANLSAAFGLAPAAVARGAVTCRVSSMSFGEDGSLEGTFAVAAENAGRVVAESGELAGNVKFTVLGAERLGGAFEPLDPSCGAELLSRKPPYAFRVAAPGKNAFFKIHLETEDVFE